MLPSYLDACGETGNPRYTKKSLTSSPVDFFAIHEKASVLSAACLSVMKRYPVFQHTWPAYLKLQSGRDGLLGTLERLANAIPSLPAPAPTKLVDGVVNTLRSFVFDMGTLLKKLTNEGDGSDSKSEAAEIFAKLDEELQHLRQGHLEMLEKVWQYIESEVRYVSILTGLGVATIQIGRASCRERV